MVCKKRGSVPVTTGELMHPYLWLPVRRIHFMFVCPAVFENPILTGSPNAMSSAVSLDNFRLFVKAVSGAPPDIHDVNIVHLPRVAGEFRFVRWFREIEAYDPRCSVARSAT
jgi:hypothetical protein